jgi:hypothetical protein
MGKSKRNRSIRNIHKTNHKMLDRNNFSNFDEANEYDDKLELISSKFEIKSPRVKIDWSNPYEQNDLDYNIVGWEQGLS